MLESVLQWMQDVALAKSMFSTKVKQQLWVEIMRQAMWLPGQYIAWTDKAFGVYRSWMQHGWPQPEGVAASADERCISVCVTIDDMGGFFTARAQDLDRRYEFRTCLYTCA